MERARKSREVLSEVSSHKDTNPVASGSHSYDLSSVQFTQSCPTLCDPMNCGTPGLPVHRQLLEFSQTHVHWVDDAIPCHLLLSPHPVTISSPVTSFSSCLQSFPGSGSFPMSQLFSSGDQSIGASTSSLVLPMSIQGWFPLGWTGLISLLSKRLSRVFSSTTYEFWRDTTLCP